ncbi:PREDICTED: endocuticle structural glycoprotein ABD-5-like isoform X1 [Vollenhovia emeryi]|uniref:endocuticle structural glycoprotein ABD-5-like isoform X1 n=1 Tax=Vollenhovia emeryi TaxID=411798 RepID=UPI0005F41ADC|nr:PREDICTED: endocuticle structural glycoprotein ABD-5-like isoform X1 [Vollenhovia emeryi]
MMNSFFACAALCRVVPFASAKWRDLRGSSDLGSDIERRRSNPLVFVILALTAGVLAAPQGNPNDITIVKQEESNNIGVGGYHFSYEQSDGQKREETAELKNEGTDNESMTVVGSFSFIAPDGHTYRVDYTADENGFHPTINLAK